MNKLTPEIGLTIREMLGRGDSIRSVARTLSVAKQTVQNWKDRDYGLDGSIAPGSSKNEKESIYQPVAERLAGLALDEYFDLPDWPRDEASRMRLSGALRARKETHLIRFAIRSLSAGAGLRIIRVGMWESLYAGTQFEQTQTVFPVLYNPRAITPEERELRIARAMQLRAERRELRRQRVFDRHMRLGAPSIWLGQFIQSRQDSLFLAQPRVKACSVKGCVYPHNGSDKCRYHNHFFDFKWSMEWRALGYSDVRPTEETPIPLLSTMQCWEEKYSAEQTVFEHKGQRDKGRKLSADWWRENVEKYMAELPKPKAHVRVIGESKPEYAPELSVSNIQHTGAFVLWKGFGKKKIRKKQRMRPQGWHGNHPEQKPRERFGRETLDDVPMWAPQPKEEVNEDVFLDDEGFVPLYEDSQDEAMRA